MASDILPKLGVAREKLKLAKVCHEFPEIYPKQLIPNHDTRVTLVLIHCVLAVRKYANPQMKASARMNSK
jgi:hypothetical protein